MDGFQATRAIRQLQDWQEVPIIGLTAGYVKDNAKLYTDAGLTDCIAKPFRVQELERVIDTWVHKR
jgi:CheY-like chemotaxis protein